MSRQPTEVRRRQIGEAALEIISREGLGRFTTAAIAAEVGISEGALFRHVGSKAEIVGTAVDVLEELLAPDAMTDDGDPLDQLGAFFRHRVDLMQRKPGLLRILFSDQLTQAASADTEARIVRLQQRSLELVQSCLQKAHAQGLLKPGLPVSALFPIVHGTALALAFTSARKSSSRRTADPRKVWQALESMLRK